ncbi:tetratricopeptide repeat protein [Cesiribacter andamanensis]|uniref:Outer membrane protein beta-barrel domain-containing protein n=1 Tax=Cesiribacter andamanensis AMV16 TaxID=1279009 RepID=M7N583_9BACT|nr:hypothetical protein [Cesiribacter andamanensis]EMR02381.1 hypothetical protein ADICEAN_02477 [Cesiribacter andamanensis AMV16]
MRNLKTLILLLFVTGASLTAYSQSADFLSLESQIKGMIQSNRWDDVLMAAPDLIIADPGRAEGYYYTALAFVKIGQPAQAGEYLKTAKELNQQHMADRISQLEAEMAQTTSLQQQQGRILAMGNTSSPEKAAAEWKRLWELDRSKIENGLEAVERYIELKQWEEALAILQDPVFAREPKAQQLIALINQTPEMKRLNGFRDALAQAQKAMQNRQYRDAIAAAQKALSFQADHAESKKIIATAEDELAWETATKAHSVEAYETYLNGRTQRTHAPEAHQFIRQGLMHWGEEAAKKGNVADMEAHLLKYLSRYPAGQDVAKAKSLLCETYLRLARAAAEQKTSYGQQQAIELFNKASQQCAEPAPIQKEISTAKRKEKRFGRPDRFYMAYLHDSLSPIGFSMGTINNRSLGFYFSVRGNEDLFTETDYFTVDDQGRVEGNVYEDIRYSGTKKLGNLSGTIGLTKKITYPLWVYAGAGLYHSRELWEMDSYDDRGYFVRTSYAKNTDHLEYQALYESGLILDLSGLHLRAGFTTLDFKEMRYSLGVGFSFRR